MDTFNRAALRRFVDFVVANDPQIAANRREARVLFVESFDDAGEISFPSEKADKVLTFLSLNDHQVHGSGQEGSVSIYAFIRLTGDLRRRLGNRPGSATSGAGSPAPSERGG